LAYDASYLVERLGSWGASLLLAFDQSFFELEVNGRLDPFLLGGKATFGF